MELSAISGFLSHRSCLAVAFLFGKFEAHNKQRGIVWFFILFVAMNNLLCATATRNFHEIATKTICFTSLDVTRVFISFVHRWKTCVSNHFFIVCQWCFKIL